MFKIVITILLSIQIISGECLQGCRICSSNNNCMFCDFQLNYALVGSNCKIYSVTNCAIIDSVGNCLTCSNMNYLDPITGNCLPLAQSNALPNCLAYSSTTSCSLCASGFYVLNGLCVAVPTPIVNCNITNSADPTRCSLCQSGYVSDQDQKTCIKTTPVPNCAGYSVFQCTSCINGYLLDMNMNLSNSQIASTPVQRFKIQQQLLYDNSSISDQGVYSTCNPIQTPNCLVYLNVNVCLVCAANYYLDSFGQCQAFPKPIILNCNTYLNFETCLNCNSGYYLASPSNCIAINTALTPTCTSYNSSASVQKCIQCVDASFLNADGICQSRAVSQNILNCLTKRINQDLCAICTTGYVVTGDGLQCLFSINNCAIYEASISSTPRHVCKTCLTGYYLNNEKNCIQITIKNCVSASLSNGVETCTKCIPLYYIDKNVCKLHPTIPFCSVYSEIAHSTCSQCVANYFLFRPSNICLASDYIMKCLVYFSTSSCETCADRYYVLNGICVEITSPPNCLQIVTNRCTKCQPGYVLTSSNTCSFPDAYFSEHCQMNNANGLVNAQTLKCSYCKPGAIPMNYDNSYVCGNLNNFPSASLVPNCNRYSNVSGNYLCTYCGNYFLDPDTNLCVLNCRSVSSTTVLMVIEAFNQLETPSSSQYSTVAMGRPNVCVSGTNYPGCAVIFPDLFTHPVGGGLVAYACGVCQTGFTPIIAPSSIIWFNTTISYQTSIYKSPGPVQNYPAVKCVLTANLYPYSNAGFAATINNCDMYYQMPNNFYGCYKCIFGHAGVVMVPNTANPAGGIVGSLGSCTSKIPDCSAQLFYDVFISNKAEISGYSTNLGFLYSCHVCNNVNEIPYIAIDFSVANTIPRLTTWYIPTTGSNRFIDSYSSTVLQTNCYFNAASSFGYTSNYNYVLNCGLGVINVQSLQNSAKSADPIPVNNQAGTFCYACQPGYQALRIAIENRVAPLMVYKCNLISNCQTSPSTWFNACSKCTSGYVYQYDSTNKNVRFDTCIAYSDLNCLTVNTNGLVPLCVICNTGFVKNSDGVCESIQAPNCVDSAFMFNTYYSLTFAQDQHSVAFYLLGSSPGCLTCAAGFVGLQVSGSTFYCTSSSYIMNSHFISVANSIYSQRCTNYGLDPVLNTPTCIICIQGYIQNLQGGCIPQIANCLVAVNTASCNKCQTGYTLILGACQLQNIANCVVYSENPTASAQTCQTCANGYYSTGLVCIRGSVANCVTYQSKFVCQECEPSFYPVQITGGTTYCFPIPSTQNCMAANAVFINNIFTCSQCTTGYVISTTNDSIPNSVCFPIVFIPNCISYNIGNSLASSTYTCTNCTSGYYLITANSTCVSRNNVFRQCSTYSITSDVCLSCVSGYFLDSAQTACIPYPTGILGCINYVSAVSCTQCDKGLYFTGTNCSSVPSNQVIANCNYYKDAKTCVTCANTYALISGVCVQSSALNCLTWASVTGCASCYTGYGFQTVNGIKNCVQISDQQCITYAPFHPFSCSLCKTGYFPLNGVCTAVTTPIQNCIVYDSTKTCITCSPTSVLNGARTACLTDQAYLNFFDPKCNVMNILTTPVCNKCAQSYLLSNNTCNLCSNATVNVGCYYCSPFDQNQCMTCKSGYYQLLNGTCVGNNVVSNSSTSSNGSKTTDGTSNTINTDFATKNNYLGFDHVLAIISGVYFLF